MVKSYSKSFTLIELIITMAIVSILAAAIFVALDPVKRFADTRDSRRYSDLKTLIDALFLQAADQGAMTSILDADLSMIGTAQEDCEVLCGSTDPENFELQEDAQNGWESGSHEQTEIENSRLELNDEGQSAGEGEYISSVQQSEYPADWERISWIPQAPYGKELPNERTVEADYPEGNADMSENVLLMHLNETEGTLSDSSGRANHGTYNGALYAQVAKLSTGIGLDGVNDYIGIADTYDINLGTQAKRTIEVWFKVNDKTLTTRKQVIFEEGGGIRGMNIYLYNSSLYVGGWNVNENGWTGTFLSTAAIESGKWHHVAFVLEGTSTIQENALKGYLDGVEFASGRGSQVWNHIGNIGVGAANEDTKFHDGSFYGTGHWLGGALDELAVYNRPLSASEILDHYKRGALRLDIQVRSCDDVECEGEYFQGPSGTSSDVYSELNNLSTELPLFALQNLGKGEFFQYQITLQTDKDSLTPQLNSITMDYSIEFPEYTTEECIDLNPILNDYLPVLPVDPDTGTQERTYYAIKKLEPTGIKLVACSSEGEKTVKLIR